MTTAEFERLWTVEDVAAFLQVPVATLYDWRRTKRGPLARRVGKYLRYKPQDVRDWFNQLAH
jgi:predicted DNA-binding transcriptional regulator AlpA